MTLKLEWSESVLVATINRPERKNAVDQQTLEELAKAVEQASERETRVIVLTGAAETFCSGADLSGVRETLFTETLHKFLIQLATSPSVTIAAIDGHALGAGAQLVVACDVRVATPTSVIGVPAAKLGLVVNHWTIERIVRELSWPVARNMLLTASNYSAEELARMGSIHRLGTLDDALAWASDIAKLAPLTIRGHKVALESSAGEPNIDALVTACREEALASNDAREGREAFMEKRQPKFTGS
jgi:enoyl-CoA hydratase